jgi:ribosomal protein S18 acetylase RimI-like enzyme
MATGHSYTGTARSIGNAIQGASSTMDNRSHHESTLAAANALENPLEGLESLLQVQIPAEKDGMKSLTIEYICSRLSPTLEKQCLQLFERNMGDLYNQSSWGLDMKEKRVEIQHEHARFLVVTDEPNNLLAFCHFRFDWNDDDDPTEAVLYVYEIQVHDSMRRAGLGRRLMSILELVARQAGLNKTMLTVFKDNTAAWNFYTKKLTYKVDDTSPSLYGEEVDYEILSKRVR